MNDGDMKKFSGTGSIGLISSRLNLQRAYHQGQDLLLHLASAYLPRLDHSLHHAFHEPEK